MMHGELNPKRKCSVFLCYTILIFEAFVLNNKGTYIFVRRKENVHVPKKGRE